MCKELVCGVAVTHLNIFATDYSCMKLFNKVISDLVCVLFLNSDFESLTRRRSTELLINLLASTRVWLVPTKSCVFPLPGSTTLWIYFLSVFLSPVGWRTLVECSGSFVRLKH